MLRGISLKWKFFLCTALLCLGLLTTLHAGEDAPFITDDAEYAVMSAILFHEVSRPEVTGKEPAQKDPSLHYRPKLAGIPSSFFNLSRFTTTGSLPDKELDRAMIDDFNRKNAQEHQIDPEKLSAVTPKGNGVTLITPKRFSMDEEPRGRGLRAGTTYISRPGFNRDGTGAVLQVSHVADREMGIGYRVMLEKSPRGGVWAIVDVVVNRRY